jgi:Kdo2-lipid IVA lauroyltransferase/acyltransferase
LSVPSSPSPSASVPVPPELRRHPGFWALWAVSRLPFGVLYGLADALAWLVGRVVRYRRRVVDENLRKSFPERSAAERNQLARTFYRNLADALVETVKLLSIESAALIRRVELVNDAPLRACLTAGQTVLVLGSHSVNWEWVLPAGAAHLAPLRADGVYRPLNSRFADALMNYLRTRTGGRLVRMQDVGRDVVRQRATPRILCMMADQTPPGGEIQFYTTFLHQDTPFFVGPDKLAASFRLPVFFLSQERVRRGHYRYTVHPFYDGTTPLPIPPKQPTDDPALHPVTAAYARFLEADIRRAPADYLWSHKRWKNARW